VGHQQRVQVQADAASGAAVSQRAPQLSSGNPATSEIQLLIFKRTIKPKQ